MKKKLLAGLATGMLLLGSGGGASASSVVSWTDWSSSGSNSVLGSLHFGATAVGVTFSGSHAGANTNGGANYWTYPTTYTSTIVGNAPATSDIIRLASAGTKTITFSEMVQDPILALVSWNNNSADFGVPIQILSYGQGYWGNGTLTLNATGTGFIGAGEAHGVIMLPGQYSSITFTDTNYENWHGITVGAVGLATPEPATMLLLGSGLAGLIGARRRKKAEA